MISVLAGSWGQVNPSPRDSSLHVSRPRHRQSIPLQGGTPPPPVLCELTEHGQCAHTCTCLMSSRSLPRAGPQFLCTPVPNLPLPTRGKTNTRGQRSFQTPWDQTFPSTLGLSATSSRVALCRSLNSPGLSFHFCESEIMVTAVPLTQGGPRIGEVVLLRLRSSYNMSLTGPGSWGKQRRKRPSS